MARTTTPQLNHHTMPLLAINLENLKMLGKWLSENQLYWVSIAHFPLNTIAVPLQQIWRNHIAVTHGSAFLGLLLGIQKHNCNAKVLAKLASTCKSKILVSYQHFLLKLIKKLLKTCKFLWKIRLNEDINSFLHLILKIFYNFFHFGHAISDNR